MDEREWSRSPFSKSRARLSAGAAPTSRSRREGESKKKIMTKKNPEQRLRAESKEHTPTAGEEKETYPHHQDRASML